MATIIQMPKLGHAMTEGTVLAWHKREGDTVKQGDPVLTVETDKAQVEVEAPASGILGKQVATQGAVIRVGGALAVITQNGEQVPDLAALSAPPQITAGAAPSTRQAAGATSPRRIIASPRAKRLAAERGVDLSNLKGSGPDGMITEDDVSRAREAAAAPQPAAQVETLIPSHREKLTRIQQAGARNLSASWKEIPHFVQMVRVDMKRAMEARETINRGGAHLSVTDVILAAVVLALRENPRANSSYRDGELLIYEQINLGIAVDAPEGLVVPVVHDAGELSVADLSARISEIAGRARNKHLRPADLEGATFTVSNLGAYGVENGTPVIFAPQAALMFAGAICDEVLAVEGRAEVRPAMHIAIAYDHRAIDGATASRFTTRVKNLLEAPEFLGAPAAAPSPVSDRREVAVESIGDSMKTQVTFGPHRWRLDGEHAAGPDPVLSFLGALGSCLLMSLRVAAQGRKLDLGRASVRARANQKGHVKEIQVELEVQTSEDDEKLKRLVEVAERGCHIRALIRDDVSVDLKVTRV
ncbi:MAG TPA: 2-oxo acid dehydrogenase subunit E2 [Candidatus Binataceae bacterium]